ncbi:MAG: PEGA domain-containing protein [bacterium]
MTLSIRRYLYLFFIAAFLVITTLVITYANGYSLLSRSGFFVKTGMLILDTEPQGAVIYLNNELQKNKLTPWNQKSLTTPAKIKNLIPGEYEVKLELAGYNTWQKKLTILPGQATFAETVILFKKDTPIKLSELNVADFSLNFDNKLLALQTNNKLVVINTTNSNEIYNLNYSGGLTWNKFSNLLLLTDGRIVNFTNQDEISTINSSISGKKPVWISATQFASINNNNIQIYNTDQNSTQIIDAQKIGLANFSDIAVKDRELYAIGNSDSDKAAHLIIFNIDNLDVNQKIKLPGQGYTIIEVNKNLVALENKKYSNLIIIDKNSDQPLVTKISNFKQLRWTDEQNIYYSNEHELYYVDLKNNKSQILARISQNINDIYIHPSNNYLIFTTDTSINTLELDDRDHHNINNLVTADKIIKTNFDDKLLQFYYTVKNNDSVVIYKFFTK